MAGNVEAIREKAYQQARFNIAQIPKKLKKKKKKDSPLKISKSCTRLIKAKDTYCVTMFKNTFMAELLLQFNTAPCKFRELFLTFKIDAAETAISPPC